MAESKERKPGELPSEWADRRGKDGLLFDDVLREMERWVIEMIQDQQSQRKEGQVEERG